MFWFIKRLCNAGSIFMINIPSGGHRCGYWLQPASPSSPGGFLGMGKVRHGTWRSTPTKRVTLCRTKWCAPLMHRNPAVLGQQYHFYIEISEYTLRFFFKLVNLHKKVAFFFLIVQMIRCPTHFISPIIINQTKLFGFLNHLYIY